MTDESTPTPRDDQAASQPECVGGATPEELLAEQQPDDPEVGADGTGMGELP